MHIFTFSEPGPGLTLKMCAQIDIVPRRGERWYQFPDEWVIDYSRVCCGSFRTEFSQWRQRDERICHIYPPGRRYAEYAEKRGIGRFVTFSGAPSLGVMEETVPSGL